MGVIDSGNISQLENNLWNFKTLIEGPQFRYSQAAIFVLF